MELVSNSQLMCLLFIITTISIIKKVIADTRAIEMTKLERKAAFDDNTCLSGDLIISEGVGSLPRCAFICIGQEGCNTMFYNQKEGKCHGCSARYSSSSLPSPRFLRCVDVNAGGPATGAGINFTACEIGWSVFQDSCYSLSPSGTFQDGVTHCQANSAHPVYVETSDENEFLKSFLTTDASHVHWYMGITDSIQGEWRYYSTNELVYFLDFYHTDDVDNSQQCAVYVSAYGFNYKWADHWCTEVHPTICEKKTR